MNIVSKAAMVGGLIGTLALVAAAPASAQIIVRHYGPYGYVAPYGDYAYVPSYRYWPLGYDTSGMPYSSRDLGWQPGWSSGAPANPCWSGQRAQNRC